jgi:gliding motility-associated-like protein
MKKYILIGILCIAFGHANLAQKPTIVYMNKFSGTTTEIVDIIGTGFSNDPSRLKVFFGAASAAIISSSETLIKAKVPPGATYDNIKVINLNSRLSGVSNHQFMMSFGGEEFLNTRLTSQEIYTGASPAIPGALLDFCVCDLDGDGKNDWIAGHDQLAQQPGVYIVKNNSTPGNISSAFSLINLPAQISYVTCGDVNNDGKPDIIAVRGGENDRVYVLINNSTGPGNISFLPFMTLVVPNARRLSKVKLEDLDNDGLPDIIITDNTNQSQPRINNAVHIFKNKSANGIASFETTPITIRIQEDTNVTGDESFISGVFALDVKDLNNDGFPELIIAPLLKPNVCIIRNTSSPGKISFGEKTFLIVTDAINDLKIAEINGDGKPDIVVAKADASKNFSVFINETGENGIIKFGSAINFPLSKRSSSLDVGDINGDGKTDIVFSSFETTSSSICILINTSVNKIPSFMEFVIPTRIRQAPIKIMDVDNDGRPDISVGLDDNRLGIFLNKNCVVAKTNPLGNVEICLGNTLDISTVRGINLIYTWKLNGVDITEANLANTPVLNAVGAGQYQVTINSDNGACTSVSAPVNVTVNLEAAPEKPTIIANTPACMGETLELKAQNNGGAVQYNWEGPGGWTSVQQNPVITNVNQQHVGYYVLGAVGSNGCASKKDTMLINVLSLPTIEISGPDAICSGTAANLYVPDYPDHQYQWKYNGNVMSGKTTSTISVDQIGTYSAVISKSGCSYESKTFTLESITLPLAAFEAKNEACVKEPVSFTNTSTIPLQREVVYQWEFGDGNNSIQQHPTHTYTSTGNFNVRLKVAYENTTCISETQKQINIRQANAVTIAAGSDIFCHGDSIKLEIQGTYPLYEWSNGKKTKSIYANTGGTYTAKITDPSGCTATAEITVSQYPKHEINVATSTGVTNLDFGKHLQLLADDQYDHYKWSPASGLNDDEIYNPMAGPRQTTTYTVTATDENGCTISNSIILTVSGTAPKLKTAKIFSPNGDSRNQYWEIEDVFNYQDNEVIIYDGQGKKVFEASPYINNWDATLNGSTLPEGVYYFVLRLRESGTVQTGSVMVVR